MARQNSRSFSKIEAGRQKGCRSKRRQNTDKRQKADVDHGLRQEEERRGLGDQDHVGIVSITG